MKVICSCEELVAINQIVWRQIKGDRNHYCPEILNPRTFIKFTHSFGDSYDSYNELNHREIK
jgi:hypothetical protein